jgi:hypothetical protein
VLRALYLRLRCVFLCVLADVVYTDAWQALQSRKVGLGGECWWCVAGDEAQQLSAYRPELARMISESGGADLSKAGVGRVEWSHDGCSVTTMDELGPYEVLIMLRWRWLCSLLW